MVAAAGASDVCVGGTAAGTTASAFLLGERSGAGALGADRLGGLAGIELRLAGSGKSKMTPHCSQRIFLRA